MKIAAMIFAALLLGGCVADSVDASASRETLGSTSSRRVRPGTDSDQPQRMCGDTSIAGEARTVCY